MLVTKIQFTVEVDASDVGVRAILFPKFAGDNKVHPYHFYSTPKNCPLLSRIMIWIPHIMEVK